MTDYHVHIGQYGNVYFYADRVFFALKENGISECWFSSTTSCIYCMESEIAKADKEIFETAPTARELFDSLIGEMKSSLECAKTLGIKAHPLYWVVPDIHKSGIELEESLQMVDFEGFKIHPRAQNWNLENPQDYELAEKVFELAEQRNLSVVIHTGQDDAVEGPRKFEKLIARHPNCHVQLCHVKNTEESLYMLKNYPNVVVDSAFSNEEEIKKILDAGELKNRVLWGTDFPVTYWYENREKLNEDPTKEDLCSFYKNKDTLFI